MAAGRPHLNATPTLVSYSPGKGLARHFAQPPFEMTLGQASDSRSRGTEFGATRISHWISGVAQPTAVSDVPAGVGRCRYLSKLPELSKIARFAGFVRQLPRSLADERTEGRHPFRECTVAVHLLPRFFSQIQRPPERPRRVHLRRRCGRRRNREDEGVADHGRAIPEPPSRAHSDDEERGRTPQLDVRVSRLREGRPPLTTPRCQG